MKGAPPARIRRPAFWMLVVLVPLAALFGLFFLSGGTASPEHEAPFSLVVGTQVIDAKYRFTDEPALVEMAKAVEELGSDTLKLSVSPRYPRLYHIKRDLEIKSVRDLVSKEPSFKAVFDMPFRNIMFWLYPFSDSLKAFRTGKLPQDEADRIYKEIYEFTAYLLQTYSGTGKSFFIGNWEGDWHTVKGYDMKADPTPEVLGVMRQWLLLREKAIADARRETDHHDVKVYFYVEINHVAKAMKEGRPAIVNKVLPHIRTDFVSYSSYDVSNDAIRVGGEAGRKLLFEALDYIETHLPPSDIQSKRVMIGEYGVTYESVRDPKLQAKQAAEFIQWGIEWGCPFVLYWQLYCNEINERSGNHRGYWLIDDKGVKQPVWDLHQDFLRKADDYVTDYQRRNGKLPSQEEYCGAAKSWLKIPPSPASPDKGN